MSKLLDDPKKDLFSEKANEIEKRHQEFFNNHPLNTDKIKHNIHHHCMFMSDGGGTKFAVVDSDVIPPQITKELYDLFREIYLSKG